MKNGKAPRTLHRSGDYLSPRARLLEIDARIRLGGRPSHAQLARELGVSVRTIQRDVDYLRGTIGAPLGYDGRRRGWYYTEDTFFLPNVLATADDLLALLLIRQAIEQYAGTPYADAARRAFDRIEQALPERERLAAEWVKSKVAFTDFPPPEIQQDVWQAILESLRTSHTLEIAYAKPGKKAETRRVDPYGLIVSEGDWYLYAHDHLRDARRTFLLARIKSARVTEESYRVPTDFDLAAYVRAGFGGLQADSEPVRTVRITFTKVASPLAAERMWHTGQREAWDTLGRLSIEIDASALFSVARRLRAQSEWIDSIAILSGGEEPIHSNRGGKVG